MLSIVTEFLEMPEPDVVEGNDVLAKLFHATALEAAGVDGEKLAREMAPTRGRATEIYKAIAAAQTPTQSLEKNTPTSTQISRTEVTRYASGVEVSPEGSVDLNGFARSVVLELFEQQLRQAIGEMRR